MENYSPPPQLHEGLVSGSVRDEYDENTTNEIVWLLIGRCVPGAHRPSRHIHWHAQSTRLGDVQYLELPGSRPALGKWVVEDRGSLDPRLCSVPSFL
jgi:hypothetical protein